MLCVNLKSYNAACGATSGGVSNVWFFDPTDFNFTQAAAGTDGSPGKYTAIALRAGATAAGGAKMFPVSFQRKEAEFIMRQTVAGCSVSWAYEFNAQLPNISHELNTFLMSLDAAGCCCGLGMVVRLNSGRTFIAGERFVNGEEIPYFEMKQDGTELNSGKIFSDFSGSNMAIRGEYSRPAFELDGSISIITDLENE